MNIAVACDPPKSAAYGLLFVCRVEKIHTQRFGDAGRLALAVDLHTALAANQRDGVLTATAVPVRRGRNLIVIRTEVTGDNGRLLIAMTTTHVPAR